MVPRRRPPLKDATHPLPDLVELSQVLALMQKPEEIERFLRDLLSPSELAAVAERWAIVKRLDAGYTQRETRDALGCGIATVTRGERQLRHGTGGFKQALWLRAAWTGQR